MDRVKPLLSLCQSFFHEDTYRILALDKASPLTLIIYLILPHALKNGSVAERLNAPVLKTGIGL